MYVLLGLIPKLSDLFEFWMQFEAKFFGANYRPLGIKLLVLLLLKQGPSFDVFSGTENRCTFFGGSLPQPWMRLSIPWSKHNINIIHHSRLSWFECRSPLLNLILDPEFKFFFSKSFSPPRNLLLANLTVYSKFQQNAWNLPSHNPWPLVAF